MQWSGRRDSNPRPPVPNLAFTTRHEPAQAENPRVFKPFVVSSPVVPASGGVGREKRDGSAGRERCALKAIRSSMPPTARRSLPRSPHGVAQGRAASFSRDATGRRPEQLRADVRGGLHGAWRDDCDRGVFGQPFGHGRRLDTLSISQPIQRSRRSASAISAIAQLKTSSCSSGSGIGHARSHSAARRMAVERVAGGAVPRGNEIVTMAGFPATTPGRDTGSTDVRDG